jgi:N-acyl-D-amino-acid deacylase
MDQHMSHDLVIRQGNIVDGTGADALVGDVAIDGNVITEIGEVSGKGKREIEAEGHAVTPGFMDLHTHLDAQIGWDPMLTSISWHGVTTALMGNCSVCFAPVRPDGHDFLAEMMESVENIPRETILEGLPWDWESYGEYLDSIEKNQPGINVAGMVGHSALRYYVMGERGVDEDPNEDETRQMAALAAESIRQGAIGFSTNRLRGHKLPDGRLIPGTLAPMEEVVEINKAVGAEGGIMQVVANTPAVKMKIFDYEMELFEQAMRTGGNRLLFSSTTDTYGDLPSLLESYDRCVGKMHDDGLPVYGTTVPRRGGNLSGLKNNFFFSTPSWSELRKMTFTERLAAIRDEAFRNKLISEARDDEGCDAMAKRMVWLGPDESPRYTRDLEDNLYNEAKAEGKCGAELWLERMLDSDGETMFHQPFFNMEYEKTYEMLSRDWIVPGLGDAGAHVTFICDSGWPSFYLGHWVRETGRIALPEAIRKMTSLPATVLGLSDRGILAEGMKADINVIDMGRVAERHPEIVDDFPCGASRLLQKAMGYKATVCNGEVILEDDEHTDGRGGVILGCGKRAAG